jgi:hypothetical protein
MEDVDSPRIHRSNEHVDTNVKLEAIDEQRVRNIL